MIGQSTINVMNGARGRLSGAVAAVAMLCFIRALRSAPRADALVLVQVTLLAVATNLAVGVIAGVATLAAAAASRGAAAPREDDGGEAPTEIAKVYRPVG